jgi:hypothetical protein
MGVSLRRVFLVGWLARLGQGFPALLNDHREHRERAD